MFFENSTILYSKWNNDYTELSSIKYNFIKDKVDWRLTNYFGNPKIIRNEFYANSDDHIYKISIDNGTPLWQYDVSELGAYETYKGETKTYVVEKFIGVWNEELLVACSNSLIISLNIKTGKEIRRWQKLENYYPKVRELANKLPRTENFVLEKDTLLALHVFSMVKIDLPSGKIEVIDMEDRLKQLNINLLKNNSSYAIDASHIYSTATMAYEGAKSQWTYDCLIAINRATYQVDWQYKFENEGLGTNTPQVSHNKLYQLTQNNVLYVFEKE